jgi:proline dehydrogenase
VSPVRRALLWASGNRTLREHVPRWRFVRRAVRKFMPGETLGDAMQAAGALAERGVAATFTELGENVRTVEEVRQVAADYVDVLERVAEASLDVEVSVKLTHFGLDVDPEAAYANIERVADRAGQLGNAFWIDMESYPYVERTVEMYHRLRQTHTNVGICLQAYLRRTKDDFARIVAEGGWVRLVKGAYREPRELLVGDKNAVDESFFRLAQEGLASSRSGGSRLALATHDIELIDRIDREARSRGQGRTAFEVQMLYGIRSADQLRLAGEGYRMRTLIAYGSHWYPWYLRRLAERPANLWFVVRNLFGRPPVPSA